MIHIKDGEKNNVHHNWGNKILLGGLGGERSEEMRRWQISGRESNGAPSGAIPCNWYPVKFNSLEFE